LISDFGRFEESLIATYVLQILEGIKTLHSKNMTHGNLNCQNLILDVFGVIKLSDYGNLNQLLETHAHKVSTEEHLFT
jgi:serine/threonine protein kinase